MAATAGATGLAALIMTSVLLALLITSTAVVRMVAIGLGVRVLIDTYLIRLPMAPAARFIWGQIHWWSLRWLSHLLPTCGCATLAPVRPRFAPA